MHFNPYRSDYRNVQSAIDYAKSTISDLLQNKMDITKQLGACFSGTLWVDIVVVVCPLRAR
jgi:SRSO17 transposase